MPSSRTKLPSISRSRNPPSDAATSAGHGKSKHHKKHQGEGQQQQQQPTAADAHHRSSVADSSAHAGHFLFGGGASAAADGVTAAASAVQQRLPPIAGRNGGASSSTGVHHSNFGDLLPTTETGEMKLTDVSPIRASSPGAGSKSPEQRDIDNKNAAASGEQSANATPLRGRRVASPAPCEDDTDSLFVPPSGRSTASRKLKDLEPFSVEYVYERHRRRCRTTTPLASISRQRTPYRDHHDTAGPTSTSALSFYPDVHLGMLDDEEKTFLRERLMPKRVIEDAFDDKFDQRLKAVNSRNRNESLAAAQHVRDTLLAKMLHDGERRVEEHEHRVHEIEEAHRNMMAAKRAAHLQHVVQLWTHIITSVRFSALLMDQLLSKKSIETLRRTMLPMIVRKKKILNRRWDRQALTNYRLDDNPQPTPSMIRQMHGHFFQGWSDVELNALIRRAKPLSFCPGEYIMFEGDYDRVMYLITKGQVEVQIRDKKLKEKRRRKEFCAATFLLQSPAYVGEFALLCKEPRSASIQCVSDVDTWVVTSKDFHSIVDHLSPEIAKKQQDATDERRKANLRKYFSLRPEVIRKNKYFQHWEGAVLKELSAMLEPLVLRPQNRLFTEGDYDPSLYFIADGKVRLTKPSEPSEPPIEAGPGDVIGAFETFFLQERRAFTGTCLTNCDLWRLTRTQLLDLGMSDPGALVRSKLVVQEVKTAEMFKIPKAPPYVAQDPFLSAVLPQAYIQQVWQLGQPRVMGAGEHLSIEGDEARCIYIVVLGSFYIAHLDKEMRRFDDKVVVSPILGGIHSGSHYTNDNLRNMFPNSVFCEIPKLTSGGQQLKPKKSFRSGSIVAGSPTHASFKALGGSSADLASSLKVAQQEGMVGVVLGAYEFATRQTRWSATYRCASMCEVFVVDREQLESKLPQQLMQLLRTSTAEVRRMIDAFLTHSIPSLLQLPVSQKIIGVYQALKAQEKEKNQADSRKNGGGVKQQHKTLLRSAVGT